MERVTELGPLIRAVYVRRLVGRPGLMHVEVRRLDADTFEVRSRWEEAGWPLREIEGTYDTEGEALARWRSRLEQDRAHPNLRPVAAVTADDLPDPDDIDAA